MKISELIKKLKLIKKRNGDLAIYCLTENEETLNTDLVSLQTNCLYFWGKKLSIGSDFPKSKWRKECTTEVHDLERNLDYSFCRFCGKKL